MQTQMTNASWLDTEENLLMLPFTKSLLKVSFNHQTLKIELLAME